MEGFVMSIKKVVFLFFSERKEGDAARRSYKVRIWSVKTFGKTTRL
jgi:hypothetical protein